MKRKVAILGVFILCVSLFLTGGKPKLVSEAEAKEVGLAFINHVFDVNETEAVVSFQTQAGAIYNDGEYIKTDEEQPIYYYSVVTPKFEDGRTRYFAFVNAETGVAYAAEQSYALVPKMTVDQCATWNKVKGNGDVNTFDYARMNVSCTDFARKWISEKFDLKAKMLGFVDSGSIYDQDGANTNFYVVIRDGTIYHLSLAWPQLTVLEITVLNQTRPTGDLP